jgi:hypothetical protein
MAYVGRLFAYTPRGGHKTGTAPKTAYPGVLRYGNAAIVNHQVA